MNRKMSFIFIFYILLGSIIVFSGCGVKFTNFTKELTLKDIAFDVSKKSGYTVYIKEKAGYVPYLVLTSDYNGQALLLRQEILGAEHTFNDDISGNAAYYKESTIDGYLNSDFLATLDPFIQDAIVDSEITITSESSLDIVGTDTENIIRKVFLLSYTEIGLSGNPDANIEGRSLKYFKDPDRRIAYRDGEAFIWWLRTPCTVYASVAWAIGPEANGGGRVDSFNGIRPAFCLRNEQVIEKSEKVLEGQKVYVIVE